jgi:hypothetical protein
MSHLLKTPTHPYQRKMPSAITDEVIRTYELNSITQPETKSLAQIKLDAVREKIKLIKIEPYFEEDDVSDKVFENTISLMEALYDFIMYLNLDEIGTTPNGTLTIRFQTAQDDKFLKIEIGNTKIAYVLSDHNDLFMVKEGKLNKDIVENVMGLLATHFLD